MTNDISIIMGIVITFVLIGAFLPFINDAFDPDADDPGFGGTNITGGINPSSLSPSGAFSIIKSIGLMFLWTFGGVPWYIDIIFVIMRITLVITLARNIWVGGGG